MLFRSANSGVSNFVSPYGSAFYMNYYTEPNGQKVSFTDETYLERAKLIYESTGGHKATILSSIKGGLNSYVTDGKGDINAEFTKLFPNYVTAGTNDLIKDSTNSTNILESKTIIQPHDERFSNNIKTDKNINDLEKLAQGVEEKTTVPVTNNVINQGPNKFFNDLKNDAFSFLQQMENNKNEKVEQFNNPEINKRDETGGK